MRKAKEFKRSRKLAGQQYKRGEKPEAYKAWADAEKQYREWRAKQQEKKA